MTKILAILKVSSLLLDAGIGFFVWFLLVVDVKVVGEWVHLVGYSIATITGVVMCYKNRDNLKEVITVIIEILKKQ